METKDHKAVGIFLIEHIAEKVEKPLQWALLWGCVEPDFNVLTYLKGSMHGEKLRGHNYENAYERISCFVHKLERTQKKMRDTFGMYGMFLKLKWHFLLGKLTHYVADAFTFPHNKIYPGGFKDHCSYEEKLKRDLRSYIKSGEAEKQYVSGGHFVDAKALCDYIQKAHDDYIARKHDVADDITHIVEVNHRAIEGMIEVLARKSENHRLKHS